MSSDVAELPSPVSDVPDGWQSSTLGKALVRAEGGGTPPRDVEEYWNGDIPWASVKDIVKGNGTIPEETITAAGLSNSTSRIVAAGTNIFAARMGVGAVTRYPIDVAINQDLMALTPAKGLDPDFLYYWLRSKKAAFVAVATGTTVKGIRKDLLLSFPLSLPPLDEQRRIAEVLRSVDEALQTACHVVDQCEQVLRLELDSVVTNLLANGVAQEKLGEVAKVKGGKRLPKGSAYSDEPTGNPYIRVTDWRDYEIRTDDIRFISDEIAQSIWRYTISKLDLFISIAGSVGLVAAVPDGLDGAYLTENAAKICINDPKALNSTFLLAVLRSRALSGQISKHKGVGGGVPKLALFRIEDLDIPLPDLSVQAEIASSYQSSRASIEAARSAVDQLDLTRKNVMSDLLSGRVRVPA